MERRARRGHGLRAGGWLGAAFLLVLQPGIAWAQRLGGEFPVNTFINGNQQRSAVAAAPDGNFVVAWSSNGSAGTDDSGYSIQARRFGADGAALGDQFQVNSNTAQTQTYPSTATDADGNFIVVWESDESGGSIQGQRYDTAGTPVGGQFPVSTTDTAFRPAVAMAPDGSFVAVWSGGTFGPFSEGVRVLAQRFDATGARIGGEFEVNTITANNQWFPAVAFLPGGGFVVVFGSYVSAGTDTDGQSVQARLYDANGAPLGAEFQVNTFTQFSQTFPRVGVDAFGDFVVVWHSVGDLSDGPGNEVRARRYAAGGFPLGDDFQVNNTFTMGLQDFPDVAVDPAGGFAIVWENTNVSLPVQGRRYDPNGVPLGDQFTVSQSEGTGNPHIAVDASSRLVAVYENFAGGNSVDDIAGQRFAAPPGPIAVRGAVVKPGKLFKFIAKGDFTLPDATRDDPRVGGGALSFLGSSGGQTYPLPSSCWRGLGPSGDGSKGFRCSDTACKVIVTRKLIKGLCRGDTGPFTVPESGSVAIRLDVGPGTTHYCGLCGGTPRGNPERIFKQQLCPAPLVCPPTSGD